MTNFASDPPSPDTLEISLFGSGLGECLVVHLGNGNWMIVDSCLDADTRQPVALQYLLGLGLEPAKTVRLIVVSHWHDDHIEGMADIVAASQNARVVFSGALAHDEFLKLVSFYSDPLSIGSREKSGVQEMGQVLQILKETRDGKRPGLYKPLRLTQIDQLLWNSSGELNCQVYALSPSDAAIRQAITEFAELYTHTAERRRLVSPRRNRNAVVLWVRFNHLRALLGSDLEETRDPYTGWTAVFTSALLPDARAEVFKIPHHGSENAHSDAVWDQMVIEKAACSILTTYNRGPSPLPKRTDIERIRARTSQIFCTTVPKPKAPKRERAVERTLGEVTLSRRVLNRATGQIRVWTHPADDPTVALRGNARRL